MFSEYTLFTTLKLRLYAAGREEEESAETLSHSRKPHLDLCALPPRLRGDFASSIRVLKK